jgi:hypothetical protein
MPHGKYRHKAKVLFKNGWLFGWLRRFFKKKKPVQLKLAFPKYESFKSNLTLKVLKQ